MQNVLQLELGDGKLWMHLLSAAAAISSESDLSVPSHYSLSPNLTYIQHTKESRNHISEKVDFTGVVFSILSFNLT